MYVPRVNHMVSVMIDGLIAVQCYLIVDVSKS